MNGSVPESGDSGVRSSPYTSLPFSQARAPSR
ncbi:hypothetical protein SAMN05216506_103432 [Saccharopolyspora kobensis]|uniref:Uncharacterized protein n=1 Tax=Saccharopolyspora kobensis TaxID=146035 RepID=A0ABY1DW58_9PSEU|nr:hypothetical protein SAMN05216506_103432 [Saccharopolyspora kobensis]